jgi:hypothetical protein
MLGWFKKRTLAPTAEEIERLASSAFEEVKAKWIYFNQKVHLDPKVSLSQRIDLFAQPIQQLFHNKYQVLLVGSSQLFWLTIFTAILESGTHPKDEVNAATAQLKDKYRSK